MSVFARDGRPTFYFQARTRTGTWRQLSTGTSDKRLAREIDRMWELLAQQREWDLLAMVGDQQIAIGTLYDAWRDSHGDAVILRKRLNDIDIAAMVPEYLDRYAASGVSPDTVAHAATVLYRLFPKGTAVHASQVTSESLEHRLAQYPASASTRRKVHSLWSGFFDSKPVRAALGGNLMQEVDRPSQRKHPPMFYEWPYVEQIIQAQPTPERAAYFALLYGSGIEVSVALRIRRTDIIEKDRQVRAPGTKALTRDRVVRVDDRAWPAFWAVARNAIGMTHVFPIWNRHTVSDWHHETVLQLAFEVQYPLKNARHHWAATHLRAGWGIHAVQRQLGHSTPTLTLNTYGQFIPSGADIDGYARRFEEYENSRISAVAGAK